MTSALIYFTQKLIDLFSLFVLFSQHRSPENPPGNCFFQISSYSREYLRIIYEKTKGQVPLGPLSGNKTYKLKRFIKSPKKVFSVRPIGGFHAILGDTNNNGEMNKCWWTNKAS